METDQHSLFQSKAMKKVNGYWKHKPLEEDVLTIMLEQIGSLDLSFLQQHNDDVVRLEDVQPSQVRSYEEKFDRASLFSSIKPVLESKGIATADIEHARNFFMARDDKGMLDYLMQVSSHEDTELMQSINDVCGFRLYNYFQQNEGK
jgi:hypothetical protein